MRTLSFVFLASLLSAAPTYATKPKKVVEANSGFQTHEEWAAEVAKIKKEGTPDCEAAFRNAKAASLAWREKCFGKKGRAECHYEAELAKKMDKANNACSVCPDEDKANECYRIAQRARSAATFP